MDQPFRWEYGMTDEMRWRWDMLRWVDGLLRARGLVFLCIQAPYNHNMDFMDGQVKTEKGICQLLGRTRLFLGLVHTTAVIMLWVVCRALCFQG